MSYSAIRAGVSSETFGAKHQVSPQRPLWQGSAGVTLDWFCPHSGDEDPWEAGAHQLHSERTGFGVD